MPSTYNSGFWIQRAQETKALAEAMKDAGARAGMARLARKYERIALQSAYDEARLAYDSAREALRVSQGAASNEQLASIAITVDRAQGEMEKARSAMEAFRIIHLRSGDDIDRDESDGAATHSDARP